LPVKQRQVQPAGGSPYKNHTTGKQIINEQLLVPSFGLVRSMKSQMMHYLPKTIIKIMHVIHPNALVNSPSAYQAIDLVLKRDIKDMQNKKQVTIIHVVHQEFY